VLAHHRDADDYACAAVETVLRLYVVGGTQLAERAVATLRRLEAERPADASVEIIDLKERPDVAEAEGILATPLLVRVAPEPVRRIVGDLSDVERVRWSLGLGTEDAA
jgi:circadian clock protein KaiB